MMNRKPHFHIAPDAKFGRHAQLRAMRFVVRQPSLIERILAFFGL